MEENFRKYKKSYFDEILDNCQVLDYKKDEISYCCIDINVEDGYLTYNFRNEFYRVFKRGFINAKRNIDEAINRRLLNGNVPGIFLSDIQETFKGIKSKSGKILKGTPINQFLNF